MPLKKKKIVTKRSMAIQGFNIQGNNNILKGSSVINNTVESGTAEEELIIQGFNLSENSSNNNLENTLVEDNEVIVSYEVDSEEESVNKNDESGEKREAYNQKQPIKKENYSPLQIWELAHKDFNNLEIKIQWAEYFTWTEIKQWFETIPNLEPKQDLDFILWLRNVKEKDCLNILNANEIKKLRKEYQQTTKQNQFLEKNLTASITQTQTKPTLKRLIGRGGYGEVHYGQWKLQEVAVKKLYLSPHNTSESDLKDIKKELEILKNLRNRYIIQYYGSYSDNDEFLIIMDYAEKGNLTKFINDNKDKEHDWIFNTNLIRQITLGLAYIHHENIIHRDLKSENILLTNNYEVKISDFGLSKTKSISSSQSKHSVVGTLRWMAPELLRGKKYSEHSDIYALGMVMWEIVAKCTVPFKDINNISIVVHVIKGGKETIPNNTPNNIQNIIKQCWKDNPNERITLKKILEIIGGDNVHQEIHTSGLLKSSPKIQDNRDNFYTEQFELNIQGDSQKESSTQTQIEVPPK